MLYVTIAQENHQVAIEEMKSRYEMEIEKVSQRNSNLIATMKTEIDNYRATNNQLNLDQAGLRQQISGLLSQGRDLPQSGDNLLSVMGNHVVSPQESSAIMVLGNLPAPETDTHQNPSMIFSNSARVLERDYMNQINEMAELLRDEENEIQRLREQEKVPTYFLIF
jgi:hypothetical protein